jgi:fructuronate reductase
MHRSHKLPKRQQSAQQHPRPKGLACEAISLAVAAWMRWQFGVDERGTAYTVDDPLAATTRAAVGVGGGDPGAIVRALLAIEPVFGRDLPQDEQLVEQLIRQLAGLMHEGAASAVR